MPRHESRRWRAVAVYHGHELALGARISVVIVRVDWRRHRVAVRKEAHENQLAAHRAKLGIVRNLEHRIVGERLASGDGGVREIEKPRSRT